MSMNRAAGDGPGSWREPSPSSCCWRSRPGATAPSPPPMSSASWGWGSARTPILYEVRNRGLRGEARRRPRSEPAAGRSHRDADRGPARGRLGQSRRLAAAAGRRTPAPAGTSGREATFPAIARTVRVPVCVLDPKGEPVLGLRGEDFRVSEDGKPQKVTLFSGERRPLRIALALDVSGSMDNKIRQVEEALRHFVEPPRAGGRDHGDHLQRRGARGAGLHLRPRAPREGARQHRALRRHGALRRGLRGHPARGRRSPPRARPWCSSATASTPRARTRSTTLREIARRSEVPVFSIGLDARQPRSATSWRAEPPGPRRPRRRRSRLAAVAAGARRRRWPAGAALAGGRRRAADRAANRKGFDGKPLIELADDTGGRAEILKGLRALHAGQRRAAGRRGAPGRGRVDRDDPAPPVPAGLRAARTARATGGPSRSRSRDRRQRAGAQGLLRRSLIARVGL